MGMAASQARLLCITARIHDVEYQAQSIQNAKIQLATQSDEAYREYNEALDATTLTMNAIDLNSGAKSTVPANFNNLCSRNRLSAADGKEYAIRDKQGLLVVEDEIFNAYELFQDQGINDAYAFAVYMATGCNVQDIGNLDDGEFETALLDAEESIYTSLGETERSEKLSSLHEQLETYTADGDGIYDENSVPEDKLENYEATLAAYRRELYRSHAGEIYAEAAMQPELAEEFDTPLFNYFMSIYNQIKACGGCVSVADYNGMNGNAANDTDWLQAMIQCGEFTIDTVATDSKTGDVTLTGTSPSSDISIGYTQTTTIDKTALAKAEAKYEKDLRDIDKKDKQYDLTLSKLESERTALTTEYDSVKKVIEDNIERTFGIFS